MFCFFPASFISFTYTDKNCLFSWLTKKHSQFGTFSQPYFNGTFSNCLSQNSPAKGWPQRFHSRGTTGSSILDHDLGYLWRIHISGHSDFGFFNSVGASSILTWEKAFFASAACPAHPGSLGIAITFAAVICDADDPCSLNTAYDSESSFTMPPRSTTLPFVLFYFEALSPNSWDDKDPSMTQNELFCPFSLLQRLPLIFFVSDFRQLPCRYLLEFFPFLSTADFASGISLLEA